MTNRIGPLYVWRLFVNVKNISVNCGKIVKFFREATEAVSEQKNNKLYIHNLSNCNGFRHKEEKNISLKFVQPELVDETNSKNQSIRRLKVISYIHL